MTNKPEIRRALDKHHSRSPEAQAADEAQTAEHVTDDYDEWSEDPSGSDYPGVDTGPDHDAGREIDKMGYIAPVTNHKLDPVTSIWDIAHMAGFGSRGVEGHDALEGIDKMVMGEVDAMEEVRVHSWTEGGPLEIGPSEDFSRAIVPEYDLSYDDPGDWMEYL